MELTLRLMTMIPTDSICVHADAKQIGVQGHKKLLIPTVSLNTKELHRVNLGSLEIHEKLRHPNHVLLTVSVHEHISFGVHSTKEYPTDLPAFISLWQII